MYLYHLNKKTFNNIDVIKVCMAVFVIAIHTNPQVCIQSYCIQNLIVCLYSLAVPFFFTTSGFLLWNKCKDCNNTERLIKIRKWLKRILRLYIIWTIIYLPFTIYGFYHDGVSFFQSMIIFIRNFIMIGENYLSWPLWYLLAMLVAGSIIYVLEKYRVRYSIQILLCVVFVLVAVLLNYFHHISIVEPYFKLFKTTRNGFFEGFQYMMIGIIIASYGVRMKKTNLWLLLVTGYVAHLFQLFGATYLMAYAFFSLVIQMQFNIIQNDTALYFRLSSTVVYFVHMIWVGLITVLWPNTLSPICLFIVVTLLSILTAYLVNKNKELKVIKLLFS